MGGDFVIDNSVVMAWCFDDEANAYSDGVQEALIDHTALVPAVWPLEVANVLLVAERKKRISRANSGHFIALLSQLPIEVAPTESAKVFHEILLLAREHRLSSYNASYLELAICKGLPIATQDKAIIRAAKSIQLEIFRQNLFLT